MASVSRRIARNVREKKGLSRRLTSYERFARASEHARARIARRALKNAIATPLRVRAESRAKKGT
jgi:hypothetical protein